jgi:hypothetical protein
MDANSGDTITFSIGSGAQTIFLSGPTLIISKPLTIDATTQPGFGGNPLIELNGSRDGSICALTLTGGNITIKGFVIDHWSGGGGCAINVLSNGNTIQGNFIGTDPSGTQASPNGTGVLIGSSNNLIGGTTTAARNVISANDGDGIAIVSNGSGNTIQGNFIGTNSAGTALVKHPTNVGSNGNGIEIHGGNNNLIGGTVAGARNIISGGRIDSVDKGAGILINGLGANGAIVPTAGNVVQGNYIGTDVTGNAAITNNSGIYIDTAKNNTIGGTSAAARNIISGNNIVGIEIDGSGASVQDGNSASGNVVQGNYIGTNAAGTAAVANNDGVSITSANNNTIGGTAAGAGNVISGNARTGVIIEIVNRTGTPGIAQGNMIQGNLIGTTSDGRAALGMQTGIGVNQAAFNLIGGTTASGRNVISAFTSVGILFFNGALGNAVQGNFIGTDSTGVNDLTHGTGKGVYFDTSNNNTVGGTVGGAGNTIAFTERAVAVVNATGDGVLGNSIFSNAFRGIDLSVNGNRNEPAPTVTSAGSGSPGQIIVMGSLGSNGTAPFRIEFFAIPTAVSQGKTFLGAITSNGGAFSTAVAAPSGAGAFVTATATDASNNTSQFSNPQAIVGGSPAIVTANPGTTPQSTVSGTTFPARLGVTVTDSSGIPVTGITVTFTAPSAGPSGTFPNGQTSIQVQTDGNGIASTPFKSNLVAGTYRVRATTSGASTAAFDLTNKPFPTARPGPSQGGTPGVEPVSRPGPGASGSPAPEPPPR